MGGGVGGVEMCIRYCLEYSGGNVVVDRNVYSGVKKRERICIYSCVFVSL